MPRKYTKRKPNKRYDINDVKNAVENVKYNKMTYRQASEHYNVPKSVIFNRIKGRFTPMDTLGQGRVPAIPLETENEIARCIINRWQMGNRCNRAQLKELVGEYVKFCKLKTPFKNNVPGCNWFTGFMRRHPDLPFISQTQESIPKGHQESKRNDDPNFYDKLHKIMANNGLSNKPQYVFYVDQSKFHNSLKSTQIEQRSHKNAAEKSPRERFTVLACVSADGAVLPPFISFEGDVGALEGSWTGEHGIPGTLNIYSTNGRIKEPQFFNWLFNSFIPYVKNIRDGEGAFDQTALLIFNGHFNDISLRIVSTVLQNNIILMRIPTRHLFNILQPLENFIFEPLKTAWVNYKKDNENSETANGCMISSKKMFSEIIGQSWTKFTSRENIKSVFNSTGIYPINDTQKLKNQLLTHDFRLEGASFESIHAKER